MNFELRRFLNRRKYRVAALLHKPLRGAGGTADADAVDALEPLGVYLFCPFYEVTIGVDTLAFVEKHLTIAALTSADKQD